MSDKRLARDLSRRAVLIAGLAAVAGCGVPAEPSSRALPKRSPAPSPPPPRPPAYVPPAGDALPNFKQVAADFAQYLGTYDAPRQMPALVPPASFIGSTSDLLAETAQLRVGDRYSRAEIEFVQYGGLTPVSPQARSGVALVVLRQVSHLGTGDVEVVRRTLDLRLVQQTGAWRVEALTSAGGTEVPEPEVLPDIARTTLRNPRIDLPDSARWDIYSGQISPALLAAMSTLARTAALGVTVLKTGHPQYVVDGRASAPVSAHWLGRAVDVRSVGGVPIAQASAADLRRLVEGAGGLDDVVQVGAPPGLDLDGGSRRYFDNLVHADHIHVAVTSASG